MSIRIQKYDESLLGLWNDFLHHSENPSFFFHRDFINYHKDKFVDHSLLFFTDEKLIALLPAVQLDRTLDSHKGLSFGGLVYSSRYDSKTSFGIFSTLQKYLAINEIDQLIYKVQPSFYSLNQNHSDQLNLVKFGAQLSKVDVSHCINLMEEFKPNKTKKRIIKKYKNVVHVSDSVSLEEFYTLLSTQLKQRYDTSPLHTIDDLNYLMSCFPESIKIVGATYNDQLIAGILIFKFQNVIKAQYIISNDKGFELEAISVLVDFLHNKYKNTYQYLDLGTSNESLMNLNFPLVKFKESLGAIPKAIMTYNLRI